MFSSPLLSSSLLACLNAFSHFVLFFFFFKKPLPGILGVISVVTTCMWGIVAIFTLSITPAKRKYCISTWCLPHLYRSQTQVFSNEPKICHICIMLKVIPLKCIILTGILFLARNIVGVCHNIYLPSTIRGSGSSILIFHVQPCRTSETLPHVSMGFHYMPGTPGPLFPYSSSPHHRRSRPIFYPVNPAH